MVNLANPIPPAALEHHLAIVGKTGAGKSYLAQLLAERLIQQGARVCVIDPTDRYWGLRLLADGKKPSGYEPVIFGGQYGDLPLSASHGAAIAEIVGTTTTPVILATRLLTVTDRSKFFTDFAETLLRRNEGPLHLLIDEAHLFMPQAGAVRGGVSPAMLHAGNNLVSLGRGIGLRIILLSQRPAKLHKDSLTQVETLVAFRLIAPQDRNAIREWVKEWADESTGAEMMSSLPSLPTGTAWVWAPELDVLRKSTVPQIITYDSGKPLAVGRKGPALKPIDLAAVRGKLETVAQEAIANDPRRLKARIAELERDLKKKGVPDAADLDDAWADGFVQGEAETTAKFAEQLRERNAAIQGALGNLVPYAAEFEDGKGGRVIDVRKPAPPATIEHKVKSRRSVIEKKPAVTEKRPVEIDDYHSTLKPAQQKILDALGWWLSIGIAEPTRAQVAFVAGYRPGSGNYQNLLGSLRSTGFIEYPSGGTISLTDSGRGQSRAPNAPPDQAELHDRIYRILNGAQRRVLEPVISAYPETIERDQIAGHAGYSPGSGNFQNLLGSLRSLQLIDYPEPGRVRAEDILFI